MSAMSRSEYAFFVIALFFWAIYRLRVANPSSIADNVAAGFIAIVIHGLIRDLPALLHQRSLHAARIVARLSNRHAARVSMAVLIRLSIGESVVLVTNRKYGQPAALGGVLKYYKDAEPKIATEFGAISSTFAIRDDGYDQHKFANDLRLKLPLKNLSAFLDWYESGLGREDYPLREFIEELGEAGVALDGDSDQIAFSRYQSVRTLRWEAENNWYSLLSWEVWQAEVSESLKTRISAAIREADSKTGQRPQHPEAGDPERLFLASREELRRAQLNQGRQTGMRLGDNVWALDRALPLPKGWWRER